MKFFSFEILIEKDSEDPGYFAYSPSLPGCFGSGATIEEAKRSMREAVSQHIEVLLAHGQPIPQHERLVHVEEQPSACPHDPPAADDGARPGAVSQGSRLRRGPPVRQPPNPLAP